MLQLRDSYALIFLSIAIMVLELLFIFDHGSSWAMYGLVNEAILEVILNNN